MGADPAVDVYYSRQGRLVDNDVVEGRTRSYLITVPQHPPIEHRSMNSFILASHDEFERRYRFVNGKLRQITQRPEIDAEDWGASPGNQPRGRDHSAVTAERYEQITVVGDFSGGSGEGTRR